MLKKIIFNFFCLFILFGLILILVGYFFNTTSNIKYFLNLNLNLKKFYQVVDKEYEKIRRSKNLKNLQKEYLLIFKWKKENNFELFDIQEGNSNSVSYNFLIFQKMRHQKITFDFIGFLEVHNHPPSKSNQSYSALLPSEADKVSFKIMNYATNTKDSFVYKNDYENSGIFSISKNIGYQTFGGFLKSLFSSNFFVYRLKSNLLTILIVIIILVGIFWLKNRYKKSNKKNQTKQNQDKWNEKYKDLMK